MEPEDDEDDEDVIAVNLKQGIAITNRDNVLRLVDFFDADGQSCGPEDAVAAVAVAAVAHHDQDGYWAINLTGFVRQQTH